MVSIFAKLVSVGATRTFTLIFFFAYQDFSRHRKAELLRKWIALVLQGKFRLISCLVKANALVLENSIVVIITVNSTSFYETAICSEIFSKTAHPHKNSPVAKSYVSKVAGFYRSNHRKRSVKKVFLERCLQNSKACVRDSILIKLHS